MKERPLLESLLLPCMICAPDKALEAAGLPSLRSARYSRTARFIRGRHLDLGCGNNPLKDVRPGTQVVGMDVQVRRPKFDPAVVGTAERLPFADEVFDSVSMVACLNHFGNRGAVLSEVDRVLKPQGVVSVTIIGPLVGLVCHKFRFWYQDTLYRTVHPSEVDGMERVWVRRLFEAQNLHCVHEESFLLGMNRVFVFEKPARPVLTPAVHSLEQDDKVLAIA